MEEKKEPKYLYMSAHLTVDVSELFGKKQKETKASDEFAFSDEGSENEVRI